MTAAAYVSEAVYWAKAICRQECRRPGDYKAAIKRAARKAQVSGTLLWNLNYRVPKTISVNDYVALGEYYQRTYREERGKVEVHTAFGRALLAAADALAGETGDLT